MTQYKIDKPLIESLKDLQWRIQSNHYSERITEVLYGTVKAFEVDTTDYNAWQFAEILDLNTKLSWNSYILKLDNL